MDWTRAPLPALFVAVVVVLAAVTGVFLSVDFEAAAFESGASATTTSSAANADALPPVTDGYLVVEAPDAVRDDLTAALVDAYDREGLSLEPTTRRDSYDRPVVVVVVDEWNPRWNPVAPAGSATWRVVFDANGHGHHVDAVLADDALVFTSSEGPDRVVSARIDLDLSGRGVVSRPAFRDRFVRAVAAAAAERTIDQIRG